MRAAVVPAVVGVAGATALAYAWGYERKAFRLRRYDVPILPASARQISVLHVSDLHATPNQPWKIRWVRSLAELCPDIVVDTGDNLASEHGVGPALEAL